jgi:hypothetical protein
MEGSAPVDILVAAALVAACTGMVHRPVVTTAAVAGAAPMLTQRVSTLMAAVALARLVDHMPRVSLKAAVARVVQETLMGQVVWVCPRHLAQLGLLVTKATVLMVLVPFRSKSRLFALSKKRWMEPVAAGAAYLDLLIQIPAMAFQGVEAVLE